MKILYRFLWTVFSVALGVVGTAFGPDVREYFRGASSTSRLQGDWSCEWLVGEGEYDGSTPIYDTIHFDRASDDLVEGYGMNPTFGPYPFDGRNSDFAAAISYGGAGENENLVGVAIFEKQRDATLLMGTWRQIGIDGLLGGSVKCAKRQSER